MLKLQLRWSEATIGIEETSWLGRRSIRWDYAALLYSIWQSIYNSELVNHVTTAKVV